MRYVFIHIPKTGGTYAQKVLNTLNDNIIDVGHQWYNDIECEGWGSWAKDTTHKLHEKIVLRNIHTVDSRLFEHPMDPKK